jgi:hypothetical protein
MSHMGSYKVKFENEAGSDESTGKVSIKPVNNPCDRGVDVMITIFCDFRQFSAKKLALFSKTNVTINILHNLALF